ncbi:MAG: ATP-grasp domain-containing protein [Spirochaetes bacterium]|jgi:5-(carboxyamino)imidazole ribonucleotide synthase|nr:ATP-grasp domain-containing protein [Spirochaetota bacterium]
MAHNRTQLLILGGGQLGRMLGVAAARLDVELTVLDPTPDCPAAATAARQVAASFTDFDAVVAAAADADVVTVEIEHVSTAALREIARGGTPTRPGALVLETIHDKLTQRQTLHDAGVPGPRFGALSEAGSPGGPGSPGGKNVAAAGGGAAGAAAAAFGLPAVQKLRFGGYDGRGVAVLDRGTDVIPLSGPSYLEELVDIETELSVLVARGPSGETTTYPPFEMEMDPELNLVQAVLYPAAISPSVAAEAKRVAEQAAAAIDGIGMNAVELFLTTDGRVLVNEIAPRPHNSGHLTIEAAETDQFEQHLRAILGLPLGSTRMRGPAVMRNLIGSGTEGPTTHHGLAEALALEGTHVHLYGKRASRPGRKMGHLTVCRADRTEARAAAAAAARAIRTTGSGDMMSERSTK